MNRTMLAAAMLAAMGLVGSVQAKEKGAHAHHGKVVSVAPDASDASVLDIVVSEGGKKNPHEVTLKATKTTQVTLDGQVAQLSDIKAGEHVAFASETGTLDKLEISTKPHHGRNLHDSGVASTQPASPATQPTK